MCCTLCSGSSSGHSTPVAQPLGALSESPNTSGRVRAQVQPNGSMQLSLPHCANSSQCEAAAALALLAWPTHASKAHVFLRAAAERGAGAAQWPLGLRECCQHQGFATEVPRLSTTACTALMGPAVQCLSVPLAAEYGRVRCLQTEAKPLSCCQEQGLPQDPQSQAGGSQVPCPPRRQRAAPHQQPPQGAPQGAAASHSLHIRFHRPHRSFLRIRGPSARPAATWPSIK
jgi:hypothetical protein